MFSCMRTRQGWAPGSTGRPNSVLGPVLTGLVTLWLVLLPFVSGHPQGADVRAVCVPGQEVLDDPLGRTVGDVGLGDRVLVAETRDGWARIGDHGDGWVPSAVLCDDAPAVRAITLSVTSDRPAWARVTVEGPDGRETWDAPLPLTGPGGGPLVVRAVDGQTVRVSATLSRDSSWDTSIRCGITEGDRPAVATDSSAGPLGRVSCGYELRAPLSA